MRNAFKRLKRFCGFITGFIFFLSGIVKLMDPVGAGLVMNEYYSFLHLDFLSFSSKAAGVFFALAETVIGTALITGVWRKATAICAIVLQCFFTLLTLALVIFNPEMDCGCFGEAIHLTHMQTFVKNIILMAMLLLYYIPGKDLGQARKKKYVSFALVTVSVLAFTAYSLAYIPLIDFTAYRSGAKLQAGATIDTDDMYESVFIYEKEGVKERFTLENLPDSTWTFVTVETQMKKGMEDNSVSLSFSDPASGSYRDIEATEGDVMVVSVYDTQMKDMQWGRIDRFITEAESAGFKTLLLTFPSSDGMPEDLAARAYDSDYKTLITLNRSNGGITYFKNGELVRKWAAINTPDAQELNEAASSDIMETAMTQHNKGSLGFQGFLLYVFAIMLLL